MRRKEQLFVAAVAMAAALVLAVATRHGAGPSTDSIAYLSSAATLRSDLRPLVPDDHGELVLLRRFPVLYPTLLAAGAEVTGSPAAAARAIGVVLLAINLLLIGVTAGQALAGAGAAATLLTASALPFIEPHAWIWSEPLFISVMLVMVLATDRFIRAGASRSLALVLAAGAMLLMTRYAGLPIVAGAALAIVTAGRQPMRSRLAAAGAVLFAALLPLAAWLAVTSGGSAPAGRMLAFHPPAASEMLVMLQTVASWVAPGGVYGAVILLGALALLVAAVSVGSARHMQARTVAGRTPSEGSAADPDSTTRVDAILLLIGGVYLLFIVLSRAFLDADIPFDDRILLPVFVSLVVVGARAGARHYMGAARPARRLTLLAAALFLLLHAAQTFAFLARVHRNGLGYQSRAWRTSPGIEWVRRHAGGVRIYSNYPDVLFYHTGAAAGWLPWKGDPNRAIEASPTYPAALQWLGRQMAGGAVQVVYFKAPRRLMPDSAELAALPGTEVVEVLSDAIVFSGGPSTR